MITHAGCSHITKQMRGYLSAHCSEAQAQALTLLYNDQLRVAEAAAASRTAGGATEALAEEYTEVDTEMGSGGNEAEPPACSPGRCDRERSDSEFSEDY